MSGHFGLHTWDRVEQFGLTAASPQTKLTQTGEGRRKRKSANDTGRIVLIHHLSISSISMSHGTEEIIQVKSTIKYYTAEGCM